MISSKRLAIDDAIRIIALAATLSAPVTRQECIRKDCKPSHGP
jgi:hypothetical protein